MIQESVTENVISIHNNYDCHFRETESWVVMVEFDVESSSVSIFDWFGTNSQTMRSFHGISRIIGRNSHCNFATVDPLVEFLKGEEAQSLLLEISKGFTQEWNGSNWIGKLNLKAFQAELALEELIQEIWQNLPTAWTAEEYFCPSCFSAMDVLKLVEKFGSLDEAVSYKVCMAPDLIRLYDHDVKSYFKKELKYLSENNEELALRAKAFLK